MIDLTVKINHSYGDAIDLHGTMHPPHHLQEIPLVWPTNDSLNGSLNRQNISAISSDAHQTDFPRKKLVIVIHGIFGHRNYFFFPQLMANVPFHSFSYDTRGNGETLGQNSTYGGYNLDAHDLNQLVNYFNNEYIDQQGYRYNVIGLIGHSKGAGIALLYASLYPSSIRFIINISGRFHFKSGFLKRFADRMDELNKNGQFTMTTKLRNRPVQQHVITKQQAMDFMNMDMAKTCGNIPSHLVILTCMGTKDEVVPPNDAQEFEKHLTNHTLAYIDEANHNYTKPPNVATELTHTISKWIIDLFSSTPSFYKYYTHEKILAISQVENFRDLGGYPNMSGHLVKRGIIYRSGDLSQLDSTGLNQLLQLNIGHVMDLRSVPEVERRGIPKNLDTIHRHHVPVYAMEDYSPLALAERFGQYAQGPKGFSQVYPKMAVKAAPVLLFICHKLLEMEEQGQIKGIIIHCSAGKDRTGVICMLLLFAICQVDLDLVVRDYSISQDLLHVSETELVAFLDRMPTMTRDGAMEMMKTKPESMTYSIHNLQKHYGPRLLHFLTNVVGLTPEQIDKLRQILLESPISSPSNKL